MIELYRVIYDFLRRHLVSMILRYLVRKVNRRHALLSEAKPVFAFTGLTY